MYLTEEEAKQKWCPFTRVGGDFEGAVATGVISFNRDFYSESGTPAASKCIASECMAWRWDPECLDEGGFKHANPKGYCGLAGKPED